MKCRLSNLIFILISAAICLAPSLGMALGLSEPSYENRKLADRPTLYRADGSFNLGICEEASDYVSDHIALRNELSALYAVLNAKLFSVSSRNGVIFGKNDWLYYTASSDDYLHKNLISDRELYNIAHNISLIEEYCELLGKKFVFTIAPNKNTLYGENMPYAYKDALIRNAELYESGKDGDFRHEKYAPDIIDSEIGKRREEFPNDLERLTPVLETEGVNYVDLKELFEGQDETLYYSKDSHWNNKGAALVHDALLEGLGVPCKGLSGIEPDKSRDYIGDLNRMLYGMAAEPEERLAYPLNLKDPGCDPEADEAETKGSDGAGNLLMYRDSFANSLIPLFQDEFSYAYYSKLMPYQMTDLITKAPDYVIIEKAERHLPSFAEVPPVMSAPVRALPAEREEKALEGCCMEIRQDGAFLSVTGSLGGSAPLEDDSRIYIEINEEGMATDYEAFLVSGEGADDYRYACYVPALNGISRDAVIDVLAWSGDKLIKASEPERRYIE